MTLAKIMADSGHSSIDRTTVDANLSAANGKLGLIDALWPLAERFTGKRHYLADAFSRPLDLHLTFGDAAGYEAYDALIDTPTRAKDALLAYKGYDTDAIRADPAKRKYRDSRSG